LPTVAAAEPVLQFTLTPVEGLFSNSPYIHFRPKMLSADLNSAKDKLNNKIRGIKANQKKQPKKMDASAKAERDRVRLQRIAALNEEIGSLEAENLVLNDDLETTRGELKAIQDKFKFFEEKARALQAGLPQALEETSKKLLEASKAKENQINKLKDMNSKKGKLLNDKNLELIALQEKYAGISTYLAGKVEKISRLYNEKRELERVLENEKITVSIFERYDGRRNPPTGTLEYSRIITTPSGNNIMLRSTRPISNELGNKLLAAITKRNGTYPVPGYKTKPTLENPPLNSLLQILNPFNEPFVPRLPAGMEGVNRPMPMLRRIHPRLMPRVIPQQQVANPVNAPVRIPNFNRPQLMLEYHPAETVVIPQQVANFVNQQPANNLPQQILNYFNNPFIPRPFGTYIPALEYHPPHP